MVTPDWNERVPWIKVMAGNTKKVETGEILRVRLNEKLSLSNEEKRND